MVAQMVAHLYGECELSSRVEYVSCAPSLPNAKQLILLMTLVLIFLAPTIILVITGSRLNAEKYRDEILQLGTTPYPHSLSSKMKVCERLPSRI